MNSPDTKITGKRRIQSIDIFRGLTIFVMIFVNDLASVQGIPEWMKHVPADADGMTFVDLVFPAFLFIVGMSIPFSISSRWNKGDSNLKIFKHTLIRTAALLVLGVLMVNISGLNETATGMNRHLWMLLIFVFAIMVWNQYPKVNDNKKIIFTGLRILGIAGLIFLAAIYKRGEDGNLSWLHTSWWGILGLIGWAYLFTSVIYIIFKNNVPALIGMIFLSILLYVGDKEGALGFLSEVDKILWLGGHVGGHVSITLSGLVIAILLLPDQKETSFNYKLKWIITFGVFLFAAGFLLRPLYGISKIYSTPTWSLYSSAFCCFIFAAIYLITDRYLKTGWAKFLEPAGKNPLLAYILPDIFYSILWLFGINLISVYLGYGFPGIIRSIVFALLMLWFTSLLNKINIRLHL